MSRGYDGPEIDDFRGSGWESERANSNRDPTRASGTTRASVRQKLKNVREAESSSDHAIAQNRDRSHGGPPAVSREYRRAALLKERDRSHYTDRDRAYALRRLEIHALTEVRKFRVVGVDDLAT